jgi:uncharacterized protein YajQ (UPF0234 family)
MERIKMAKDEMEKINFVINDGDSFYTNEISITFGPAQFSFDFKNISPRVDMRAQDGSKTFALKHNVVILDPYQIKNFINILTDAVSKYEKEFGTIEMPKQLKMAEKKFKLENKPNKQIPTYFG